MAKTIVAIDPGKEGGIAFIADNSSPACFKMPDTEGDILRELQALAFGDSPKTAFIEQVGGFKKGSPAPGSAMFNFGRNFGFLLGSLQALGYRVELVRPQVWQKTLGLGTSNGDKTAWKNKLKQRAQQLYPDIKVTLHTADALLILEHARRQGI